MSADDERRMRALEAFPPGHPSSPYQADGSRRPAEPSLRSLELPIPDEVAEEWAIAPSGGRGKDAGESTGYTGGWYGDSTGRGDDRPSWNGDDGTSRHAEDAGEGTRKAEGPRWSTPELAEGNHGQAEEIGDAFIPAEPQGKQGTADNTAGRTRDDNAQTADAVPQPEATHRSYWTEVPRFKRMWNDHESSWPKETQPSAKVDRSGDPPGTWRSDSNLFLSMEKHDRTKEAINEVHGAESRVTEDLRNIRDESPHNAELVGLAFRRKGEDRLKEKVAEALTAASPNATPKDVLRAVPDAIRYTVRLGREEYTSGYLDICQRMNEHGYEMYYAKNHWGDSQYKGINTRWLTPQGQLFELQFHTAESYHAKQEVTHKAYERIRNPLTTRAEIAELEKFQQEVSSWIPVPDGAPSISDFKKRKDHP